MTTIKDVAKLAGVSGATVSRTLANPDIVLEKTRNKVMDAIQQTGYVMNTVASSFRSRKSNTVLVLVPDISNPFFSNIIQGIEQVAHSNKFRVLLGDTQEDREREKSYVSFIDQRQADGIILLGERIPLDYHPRRKTPDPKWPPIAMACEYNSDITLPTVCIDNVKAAEEATNHLISLGHKRIAYINGPKNSPLCRDRLKGYKQALHKGGIIFSKRLMGQGDFSPQTGMEAMEKLLGGNDERPTAVFAANDEMALGVIKAAKAAGLRVPRDVSVVGFDDIRFAEYSDPPLTTIHQPRSDIGRQVMTLMCNMLKGIPTTNEFTILPHSLIVRDSTNRCR